VQGSVRNSRDGEFGWEFMGGKIGKPCHQSGRGARRLRVVEVAELCRREWIFSRRDAGHRRNLKDLRKEDFLGGM